MSNRPPVVRGKIFDSSILANTDAFAADIVPMRPCALRFTVGIKSGAADSIVNLQITDGSTSLPLRLNSGTAATNANVLTFVVGAHPDLAINVQFETATTIGLLLVEEIQAGAL